MKLYILIQRLLKRQWVRCFVLFFILISIIAVIASSFEEMSEYKVPLFGITYISSFVFLVEYTARILSAPALYPDMKAAKARLKYTFSFYGFVDFIAVIPCILTYVYWNTEVVHIIILPYIFIIFKLIRHSRSFRVIGKALASVKEELETAYTASFITICFSAILMYYIERSAQPEVFENIGDGIWWAIITFATVGYGDIYPITPLGKLLGCIICLVGVAMAAIPIVIFQRLERIRVECCFFLNRSNSISTLGSSIPPFCCRKRLLSMMSRQACRTSLSLSISCSCSSFISEELSMMSSAFFTDSSVLFILSISLFITV